jgi:hypothetical protein
MRYAIILPFFFTALALPMTAQDFTIPKLKLLDFEFASTAWGATVVRTDGPGDSVDFSFNGLSSSSTGLKDDYPVDLVYGQILPSHGNGDFSNLHGFNQAIENLDDDSVWVSLFLNTGFTGPSGNPSNNPANDTFWQSEWMEIPPGETRDLHFSFSLAIPWGIEDNPPPHTQGINGIATAVNAYDHAEVSAIGFQVATFTPNPEAILRVHPGKPDELIAFTEIGVDLLPGWGPPEPQTHSGNWGGLALGGAGQGGTLDYSARVIWASDQDGDWNCEYLDPDPRVGEVSITVPANANAQRFVIRHLDGLADDSFNVYCSKAGNSEEILIGTYTDQSSFETWVLSEFPIPIFNNGGSSNPHLKSPSKKVITGLGSSTVYVLRFEATGPEWYGFCPYGQVAFDWITVRGHINP